MNSKYYQLLSFFEQKLYNEILQHIESYNTEWTFSQVSFECVAKVYRAVLKDHPEYFWLSSESKGTVSTYGTETTVLFRPKLLVDINLISSMRRQFNNCIDNLIVKARHHSSQIYEQILFLHDYLVLNTDYVLNSPHCYDSYGCLILHKAVCSGYAAAFQALMQKLGVECGCVSGWSSSIKTGNVPHAWNYIKLSDGYYYIDVTWDDPIINDSTTINNLSHDYFCVDYNEMQLTHKFDNDQFIPREYGQKFNYYTYIGWYMYNYSFSSVKSIATRQLLNSNKFLIKFGSKSATDTAKRDLIDNQNVFSIPGISNSVSYNISKSGLVLTVWAK